MILFMLLALLFTVFLAVLLALLFTVILAMLLVLVSTVLQALLVALLLPLLFTVFQTLLLTMLSTVILAVFSSTFHRVPDFIDHCVTDCIDVFVFSLPPGVSFTVLMILLAVSEGRGGAGYVVGSASRVWRS